MSSDGRMQEEVEVRTGSAIYEIDWRNERGSIEKERAKQRHKIESSEC